MGPDSQFGSFLGIVFSIGAIGGVLAILYFLWTNFHEYQYKDLVDKTQAEKRSNKLKTSIAFVVILLALGFLASSLATASS